MPGIGSRRAGQDVKIRGYFFRQDFDLGVVNSLPLRPNSACYQKEELFGMFC